jgi:hypothetical protein
VSFVGFRGASLRVFMGRLVVICGEMIGLVRFDGLCMFVMLIGLGFCDVSGFIRGGGAACVSKYLDSAFLPHDNP